MFGKTWTFGAAVLVAMASSACSSSTVSSPTRPTDAGMTTGPTPDTGATKPDAGGATTRDSAAPPPDTGTADSGADTGPSDVDDFPCGNAMPCAKTMECCAMPGATTMFECTAAGACPTQNAISCDGPNDCSGATPVCCAVEMTDGQGTYPSCTPSSLGTSCSTSAACNTHLGTSCTDTTSVVLCHTAADCMDPNNPECCTFGSSGASLTFCIDSTTASLGGGVCH